MAATKETPAGTLVEVDVHFLHVQTGELGALAFTVSGKLTHHGMHLESTKRRGITDLSFRKPDGTVTKSHGVTFYDCERIKIV
jgi:hypothetical protein